MEPKPSNPQNPKVRTLKGTLKGALKGTLVYMDRLGFLSEVSPHRLTPLNPKPKRYPTWTLRNLHFFGAPYDDFLL